MPLKDLIIDQGKVTEDKIENIISGLVCYELNPNTIVFMPKAASLNNEAKVLIYLVAVLGWQYVVEGEQNTDTRPAELESTLGILGGTLRPILKRLKDSHLLTVDNRHYSIRPYNLDAIDRIIRGETLVKSASKSRKKTREKIKQNKLIPPSKKDTKKPRKKSGFTIRSIIETLLTSGFFTEYRTLGQVLDCLHEKAIIAKLTSLSGPIAGFVRDDKLKRKKVEKNGKMVWAYKEV